MNPISKIIKRVFRQVAPSFYESCRIHRYCKVTFGPFQQEIERRVYQDRPLSVLTGPFTGLKYFNKTVWGPIVPKWMGTYESELHVIVNDILERNYSLVIDVGAAEGYYAVGLARALPEAKVMAFDIDRFARARLRELTRLNGLSNVLIHSECDHATIDRLIDHRFRSLIICDIEGCELELLDPAQATSLGSVDVLVEVHSRRDKSLSQVLQVLTDRFTPTHTIQRIDIQKGDISKLKSIHGLEDPSIATEAINEHRSGEQAWLWMTVS